MLTTQWPQLAYTNNIINDQKLDSSAFKPEVYLLCLFSKFSDGLASRNSTLLMIGIRTSCDIETFSDILSCSIIKRIT